MERHIRLSRVHWPSPSLTQCSADAAGNTSEFIDHDVDGSIVVKSVDGLARLVLPPHAHTFQAEWWCPIQEPCHAEILQVSGASAPEISQGFKGQRLFASGDHAAGIFHGHSLLVQEHLVSESMPPAWTYPLLLALAARRECILGVSSVASAESESSQNVCIAHIGNALALAATAMRRYQIAGAIVETDGDISAPLPSDDQRTAGLYISDSWEDEVSPTALLGALGYGRVHVVWAPHCTTWLHETTPEATIAADCPEGSRTRIISSLRGSRFWRHCACDGSEIEVSFADTLPLDAASIVYSRLITEAIRWLRHNVAEVAKAGTVASIYRQDQTEASAEWCFSVDLVVEGIGRLSVFRPLLGTSKADAGEGCLVRVLFEDRCRFECLLPADHDGQPLMPTSSDVFRLLDSQGAILRRSFGEPLGCERYADAVRRLLGRLLADQDLERHELDTSLAVAMAAERRGQVLLKLHGEAYDSTCSFSQGAASATQAAEIPLTASVSQALQKSLATCRSIEATLSSRCDLQVHGDVTAGGTQ
jgi:hypothetical protein